MKAKLTVVIIALSTMLCAPVIADEHEWDQELNVLKLDLERHTLKLKMATEAHQYVVGCKEILAGVTIYSRLDQHLKIAPKRIPSDVLVIARDSLVKAQNQELTALVSCQMGGYL